MAAAEAQRAARVGIAQAMAIEEQVRAYGGPKFQLTQDVMNRFAQAIQESRVDVVPKIVIGGGANGGAGGGTGGLLEGLLTLLLSEKLGIDVGGASPASSPEAERMRSETRARFSDRGGAGEKR